MSSPVQPPMQRSSGSCALLAIVVSDAVDSPDDSGGFLPGGVILVPLI